MPEGNNTQPNPQPSNTPSSEQTLQNQTSSDSKVSVTTEEKPPSSEEITQDRTGIKKDITLEDFDTHLDVYKEPEKVAKKEDKKVEVKPEVKTEEKKLVEKKDDKTTKLPDVPFPGQRFKDPKTGEFKDTRDYSGLSEDEVKMFKNVSNEAFTKLKPMFLEHKTLQTKVAQLETQLKEGNKLPINYFEHPEAYKLSPDYTQHKQTVQLAEAIESFWREQLTKIENGEDWNMLTQNKDGEFVISTDSYKPDAAAKASVISYMQHAAGQRQRVDNELKQFVSGYQAKSSQLTSYVKGLEKTYFPWFEDAELQKPEMKKVVEVIETAKSKLPPELQNNVFTPFLCKAYVQIMTMSQKLQELQEALETKKLAEKDKELVQPTESASSGLPQKKQITTEDFDALMRG